jgi:ATP-dependent DNA ligase
MLTDCRFPLLMVPQTRNRNAASAWLSDHLDAGIEGVVAKRIAQCYDGPRNTWRKVRTRLSDEAVIGGVIGDLAEPEALVLGRLDACSDLRIAGRTAPLPPRARSELGRHLRPAVEHPWPTTLRPRFGEQGPVTYTRVQPHVVVELEVDSARDQGRWRHPVIFRRLRLDLRPDDLARV